MQKTDPSNSRTHPQKLKGHSHAILVHFKNQKYVLTSMNAPTNNGLVFYQRLYYFTETIFCRLLLRMAQKKLTKSK